MKKLLLEETLFEDTTNDMEVEEPIVPEITDDNLDQVVADAEGDSTLEETITYKVSFTLGKHDNWSRIDASSEEEAGQLVRDYVTRKWPDRDFEVVEIEEFNEEEIEESLNESLTENAQGMGQYSDLMYKLLEFFEGEGKDDSIRYFASQLIRYCSEEDIKQLWFDRIQKFARDEGFFDKEIEETDLDESLVGEITDAQPIEDGACVGMASVISDLIKDEYEAIDGYNSAIATAEAEGFGDMINVLTEIQAEENLHIGQLQAIMNTLDPNAHLVDDGQQEGVEQLANPLGGNEFVEESLNEDVEIGRPDYAYDMTDDEYEDFRNVLTQHYGSPEEFFKRLHAYKPDFEIHRVDYDDIPEDTITLSSSDISQGTGNVIVYTVMGRDTGKIYMYADF